MKCDLCESEANYSLHTLQAPINDHKICNKCWREYQYELMTAAERVTNRWILATNNSVMRQRKREREGY